MTEFLSYTIAGLSVAAILAVGASGLVLTYTTTGVFNFAHGAIGMLGAFAYWQFRFDWNWPTPLALAIVLLVLAPLFGTFLEVVIFRGLQRTTDAVKLVVTVSLLFSIIGIANWIWNPTEVRPARRFFFGQGYKIGEVPISKHELTTIAVAIAVALALRVVLYRTRAGVAMRAAVDDRPLASLHGARPDRSSMLAWAIGCGLAATSGILFVGTIGLEPTSMSLLIINAYAAAMIGRLRSLPFTFLGALVLGLADGYLKGYLVAKNNQYFDSAFVSAVPVIVLFVVLLVLPSARLRAVGATRTREFIPVHSRKGALAFAAVVIGGSALCMPLLTRANTVSMAKLFALGIIALSLVPLVGLAGQVSLCQYSLAGVGAIAAAHLGVGGSPMGLVWAVVFAAAVGALVALPALRLSGIYLALATAAFAVFLDRWIFTLRPFDLPGTDVVISLFKTGSVGVSRLEVAGFDFASEDRQLILLASAFAFVAIFVAWLRRSPLGRRLLAMKDSEAACATIGMNLMATKLAVFAISAGIAGLGGALLGGLKQTTNSTDWQFAAGLPVFMIAVVGGISRIGGGLFAGISLSVLSAMPGWPLLRNIAWWGNLSNVTPGFMGIGLGRNPNGAVADMRQAFEPLGRSKTALAAFFVLVGATYAGVLVTGIGAWWFIIGSIVALIACTQFATISSAPEPDAGGGDEQRFGGMELEWVGIDRGFTAEDVRVLDAELGLAEVR